MKPFGIVTIDKSDYPSSQPFNHFPIQGYVLSQRTYSLSAKKEIERNLER